MSQENYNRMMEKLSILPMRVMPISGESVTIPAGAAGVVVEFQVQGWPILSADGGLLGGKGDTSLSFVTGTCFTTEVAGSETDSELANGEYYINYATGRGRGKKADAAVADTINYKTPILSIKEGYAADAEVNGPDGVIKTETRGAGVATKIDALLKTGAGKLFGLTFACTAALATAGTIKVFDNTVTGGTLLWEWTVPNAYFVPFTLPLDLEFTTGCYIDFTTTGDVSVTPSIR